MFYGIGLTELIIILFIILLIFGIGKLPEIGSGVGKAIKNFKKSLKGEDEIDVTPKKTESQNSKFKNQN
ncbi:MAG: twin-arginine translocase TatA/TatE family subunit [Nitrospinota bacterium]|jgi:sec-independent protein translocase protein TatA